MSVSLFIPIRLAFAGAVGIHVLTVRATYTVPAGHRASIHGIYLGLGEFAAAGVSAFAIVVTVNGVEITSNYNTGAVGFRPITYAPMADLIAADVVNLSTVNTVAAAQQFIGYVHIREYQ